MEAPKRDDAVGTGLPSDEGRPRPAQREEKDTEMSQTLAPVEGRLQDVVVAPGAIYHVILTLADGAEKILRVSPEVGEALFHRPRGERHLLQPFAG